MSMIIFFVILYEYQSCNHNKHDTFFLKIYKNRGRKTTGRILRQTREMYIVRINRREKRREEPLLRRCSCFSDF